MDDLRIDDGTIRLSINGDASRVISFNPKDELFAEKFYHLVGSFKNDLKQFEERAKLIDENKEEDEDGIPVNLQEQFDLKKEVFAYLHEQIDAVFGAGTSKVVFGDARNIEMIDAFFKGISPYMAKARAERVEKYIPPAKKPARRSRRK